MSAWEDDYLDEEVKAYIAFDAQGGGDFQFGYIQGQIDYRIKTRDGNTAVEFSWEGGDGADGTSMTGRAWAVLNGGEMQGEFCIYQGDDSEFVAKKVGAEKRRMGK